MDSQLLTISQAAKTLGLSVQTLRRWDDSGRLRPSSRKEAGYRYYYKSDIEDFMKNHPKDLSLFKMARNWVKDDLGIEPFSDFYCSDVSIFQARLTKLENELGRIKILEKIFPLISAISGEIGNNSFDHNLGNWPDIRGIFFAWDLEERIIILADRGQGILVTLKRVRPDLKNHQNALRVAFTEVVSGRAPEYRGNGLKFVKDVVTSNKISLFFQTGNAQLKIKKGEENKFSSSSFANDFDINIQKSTIDFRGCLALIKF